MRLLAILLALVLPACAMPRSERGAFVRKIRYGAAPRYVPVSVKPTLTFLDAGEVKPALGLTFRDGETKCPKAVDLSLLNAGEETMARNVCAHELGHVIGLDHGTCPLCWMYGGGTKEGKPLIEGPSPEELAEARECPFLVVLVADSTVPEPIGVALLWAVHRWNAALGERQFTVRRSR